MTSSSRRRAIAVAALLAAAIPALAACGAGFDANTNVPYAPNDAAVLYDGDGPGKAYGKNGVMIPQAFILGPDSGQQLAAGASAPVYLTLLNSTGTPDQLTSIVPDAGKATSVNVQSPIDLQPGTLAKTPGVTVQGLKTALRGGETIKLTLEFKNAGEISLNVPVITRSREYATLPPATQATPDTATSDAGAADTG
ncbi:MAG: hypothetical protein IRZ07_30525, partial [Microbispora sp.]|nr:hypothetical protein [Microbispora sp.]